MVHTPSPSLSLYTIFAQNTSQMFLSDIKLFIDRCVQTLWDVGLFCQIFQYLIRLFFHIQYSKQILCVRKYCIQIQADATLLNYLELFLAFSLSVGVWFCLDKHVVLNRLLKYFILLAKRNLKPVNKLNFRAK